MRDQTPEKAPAPLARCPWAKSALMVEYHDKEWGVPLHDDQALFEFLILEGAQAGLSWEIILRKRAAYRLAFDRFDAARIASYGPRQVAKLMANPGIVRNRLKIESTIGNARAYLHIAEKYGTFDAYIWQFVGGRPIVNRVRTAKQIPTATPQSDAMSKALKAAGFKFVGSTICYAFMQATGMVNDHLTACFRYGGV
jgi:DNA-3-methyladenine glycosylase I